MGHALPLHGVDNLFSSGTVRSTEGDAVLVTGKAGMVRAQRAASCLLAPQPRDMVLLALLDDGTAWVLAVLRRHADADRAAELRLPERTALRARELDIQADGARLAAERLDLRGESLSLAGEAVGITSRLLTMGGQMLFQGFSVMRTLARSLGEKAARRTGRYGALDEKVDGLARRAAGRAQTAVETSWRLRAENADMRAEKLVDIDADRIKVG